MTPITNDVQHERVGGVGFITLNRPKALNALSLAMVRELTRLLLIWQDDPAVRIIAIRGSHKEGAFGAFCAGGDIRFFHQAALAGDPAVEDFFTEEYTLNHLIAMYPKPFVAFMDGIVMGGGMGLSQGASLRIVTERTQMAMPETQIGLFPDVGGGYFLSRCPGHVGEYLALTGQLLRGAEALAVGLADAYLASSELDPLWEGLAAQGPMAADAMLAWLRERCAAGTQAARASQPAWRDAQLDTVFGLPSVQAMADALQTLASPDVATRLQDGVDQPRGWASDTLQALRQRSPLMLHVTLEQIRRGRHMTLADDLRMERDLVRHCFFTAHLQRSGASSETVEGIRALVVDKDRSPKWQPERIEDVTNAMVHGFFTSPWPAHAHPLRGLRG